jgi:hypothetical protein
MFTLNPTPSSPVHIRLSRVRVQRVCVKIVQGLFYREHQAFLPRANIKRLQTHFNHAEPQEIFKMVWAQAPELAVSADIFCYKHLTLDGLCSMVLMFWKSLAATVIFEHPPETKGKNDLANDRVTGRKGGRCATMNKSRSHQKSPAR